MKNNLLAILILVFISCQSTKPTSKVITNNNDNTSTLNGNWQLEMLFASDNKWTKTPFIIFDINSKSFTGNSGCNAIRGKFILSKSYLAFDKEMISTKIACVDARSNTHEKSFLSALLKINKYTINGNELELGQGEIVIMKFKKV